MIMIILMFMFTSCSHHIYTMTMFTPYTILSLPYTHHIDTFISYFPFHNHTIYHTFPSIYTPYITLSLPYTHHISIFPLLFSLLLPSPLRTLCLCRSTGNLPTRPPPFQRLWQRQEPRLSHLFRWSSIDRRCRGSVFAVTGNVGWWRHGRSDDVRGWGAVSVKDEGVKVGEHLVVKEVEHAGVNDIEVLWGEGKARVS